MGSCTMEHKGFKASIMKAERLVGDRTFGLPPGRPIEVFPVDAFAEPLPNWMEGPGHYVVPVEPDWGLWFDWRGNDVMNTAVLPTVKGMNPITGRRTNGFALERYEEKCPNHDVPFKEGRFCEKCNFTWPPQNYVCHPNTLWWDGFRVGDAVRQFFFTEEMARSIPEKVIGKEDTVPAFGFAFYRTKEHRKSVYRSVRGVTFDELPTAGEVSYSTSYYTASNSSGNFFESKLDATPKSAFAPRMKMKKPPVMSAYLSHSGPISPPQQMGEVRSFYNAPAEEPVREDLTNKEVGVGAGAKIAQSLRVDPLQVSDWQDEVAGSMVLYFVFTAQFREVQKKGMKDLTGEPEGFMAGLPVG